MEIVIVGAAEKLVKERAKAVGLGPEEFMRKALANGMWLCEAGQRGRVFVEDRWGRRWEVTDV